MFHAAETIAAVVKIHPDDAMDRHHRFAQTASGQTLRPAPRIRYAVMDVVYLAPSISISMTVLVRTTTMKTAGHMVYPALRMTLLTVLQSIVPMEFVRRLHAVVAFMHQTAESVVSKEW